MSLDRKTKIILFFAVFLLGIFVRFFKLSDYPVQLNHDEISQIVDVRSIFETGKDIYGSKMPLSFMSTGDYKPGHYIYISLIPYYFFGDKEFTIRIPGAFFGSLTVAAVFFLTFFLFKNFKLSITVMLLMALLPSELFYGRKSFENVIGASLLVIGTTLAIYSLEKKKMIFTILAILFALLSMYVYTSYVIIVPLFIAAFAIIYKNKLIPKRNYLIALLFGATFLIPLFIISTNHNLRFRAESVFFTQDQSLGNQLKLIENTNGLAKELLTLKTYADFLWIRYISQFDLVYLFANGLNLTNQGPIGSGPLLLICLPFFVFGVLYLYKKKEIVKERRLLLSLTAISVIPTAVTFEVFSPHRSVIFFIFLNLISGIGLYYLLFELLTKKVKSKNLSLALTSSIVLIFIVSLIHFVQIYTVNYPYEKDENIHYPFEEVSRFAWQEYNNYDSIVIDASYGKSAAVWGVATQYYLLYTGNYPPKKFQENFRYGDRERELIFDKFSIRRIDWRKDHSLKRTLIIGSSWSIPINSIDKSKIKKTFHYLDGTEAFYAVSLD